MKAENPESSGYGGYSDERCNTCKEDKREPRVDKINLLQNPEQIKAQIAPRVAAEGGNWKAMLEPDFASTSNTLK